MRHDLRHAVGSIPVILAILGAVLLAGCGGGGSSSGTLAVAPATTVISGVAATGAPITPAMGGVVTIQDSASPAHTATTPTDANGFYSFTSDQLTGWSPPYIMEVNYKVARVAYNLHSAATASDLTSGSATINITPLTDLVIANVAGDIAANVFKTQSTYASKLTPAALTAGATALATQLAPVLNAQGVSASVDLFRQSFTANGTGLDAVLDTLKVTQDAATKTAVITNRLDGSSVTNDLTKSNTATLPALAGSVSLTDLQAITAVFNNFAALMLKAPAPTDPTLLAFFDQVNFKFNGGGLAQFLQEVTSDPTLLAGTSSSGDITLGPVPTWVTTVPTNATASYRVKYTDFTSGFPIDRQEYIMYKNSSGNWITLGNQKVAKVKVRALAISGSPIGSPTSTPVNCTGLWPQISDDGGIGINFAVVTGPALPTAGLLLFAPGANGEEFVVAAGDPSTYAGTATVGAGGKTNNCRFNRSIYPLTDTAIATIAASPMTYTAKLYKDLVAGKPNAATATLVASYEATLPAAPLTNAQLTSSLFPTAATATPAILGLATGATAATTTISWTAPTTTGLFVTGVGIEVWNSSASTETQRDLFGNVTSTSIAVPQLANATNAGIKIDYVDNLYRAYWTGF